MNADLALIPDYLLGALPEHEQRRLDAMVAESPAFRREVDAAAQALADATTTLAPLPAPAAARARLLATLGSVDRFAAFLPALTELFELPVATIRRLLGRIDESSAMVWETSLMGVELTGSELFHFPVGPRLAAAGAAGGVVRIRPRTTFPLHSHNGNEVTFVLEGQYLADGRVYGPGARVEVSADCVHDYRSGPHRDLVIMVLHRGVNLLPAR